MSVVTDTILTFDVGEDEDAAIAAVNQALLESCQGFVLTSAHEPQEAVSGGGKYLQINIALAAFNYVSDEDLIAAVRGYGWRDPDCVHIFVNREHDESGFSELAWSPSADPFDAAWAAVLHTYTEAGEAGDTDLRDACTEVLSAIDKVRRGRKGAD